MAQAPNDPEEKKNVDTVDDSAVVPNMDNITTYLTLDEKKLSPTTHTLLKSWDASDAVIEAANAFIECIFKVTQRRFHMIPVSKWLQNEKLHAKQSNDGSRCRIPILFGISSEMLKRLSFEYDSENKPNIAVKVKYQSDVFIPGVSEEAIQLVDNALLIAADDQKIKEFVNGIVNRILEQFESAKKSVDNNTTELRLSLETCLEFNE